MGPDQTAATPPASRKRVQVKPSNRGLPKLSQPHPGVAAVSVVPRPDPRRGQIPLAFVVAGEAVDAAALAEWSQANMASYKVPEFVFVDALPMTATGKVRKGELFERAERIAAEGNTK
ncbi:AMP-binding enzyme [Tsukamurella paurometabola]|uniref:AMP-binding enzyme n=1 Tax=Tsukamurella paurometabola TaxID=2061 RepID=UPI00315D1D65